MDYTYHMHTPRCSHATGMPREYIVNAIREGMTHIGFSDHCPLMFEDGYQTYWKVPVDEGQAYCNEIAELRREYRDRVDIKIGFEMEYYPEHFEKTFENVLSYGAEYLILGQHFISSELEHPDYVHTAMKTDNTEYLVRYADVITEAISKGVYSYVAHPDFTCFTGDDNIYEKEIMRLALASKELDIPLEINLLGVRYGKFYPADKFWRVVGMIGSPVTVGYDAHNATDLLNKDQLRTAEEIIRRHGLNYVGAPRLRKI